MLAHTRSWIVGSILLLLVSAASAAPFAHADTLPAAFEVISEELVSAPDEATRIDLLLTVDQGLIQSDPDAVSVPLPDGTTAQARRAYWQWLSADEYHWFGALQDAAGESRGDRVSFHYFQNRLTGELHTADGGSYQIVPEAGVHRLSRLEASGNGCGIHADEAGLSALADGLQSTPAGLQSTTAAMLSNYQCIPSQTSYTVDVMVLYPLTLQSQSTTVQSYAATRVAEANMLFSNSGVNIVYRLAYVGPITAEQPPGPSVNGPNHATEPVLIWLNGQVNSADADTEVELLRKAHGADLISIVVPSHPNNNCGIANLPELNNGVEKMYDSNTNFLNKAFMVAELNCGNGDYTFAHEFGHTFGMRHEDDRLPTTGDRLAIYPWAYGFDMVQAGPDDATVMACFDPPSNCRRIPRFSNPDVPYNGRATGEHSSQTSTPSHNACVAYKRAAKYAGFVPLRPSDPPSLVISSPSDGTQVTAGVNFQLAALASDNEDGNLASSVQWYSDRDGHLGQGSPLTTSLTSGGDHLITAEVTDNSGTKVPYSIRMVASESTPPVSYIDFPSHNQHVYGNWTVSGWTTDSSGVTNISFKVNGNTVNLSGLDTSVGRGDVCAAYASLKDPNCPKVGFSGTLNTEQFSPGYHTLQLISTDRWGNTSTFNRSFRKVRAKFFGPVDDAYVSEASPATNFGNSNYLYLRASGSGQALHTYMKFNVSGVGSPILGAELKLRALSSLNSLRIYNMTDDSWSESTINWNNGSLANTGNFVAGNFSSGNISVDVTSYITGNGLHTLGMLCTDAPNQRVYSSESLLFSPELIVTY